MRHTSGQWIMGIVTWVACAWAVPGLATPPGKGVQEVRAPKAGTVHRAIVDGLRLIRDGDFDGWLDRFCHRGDLCFSDQAVKSLRRYNLPAMKRLAPHCLKGKGDTLYVTRTDGDPARDTTVKVFIVCNPKGMPRPFTMKKEGGAWKFKKL